MPTDPQHPPGADAPPERASRWGLLRKIASPILILAAVAAAVLIFWREGGQLLAQEIHLKPGWVALSFVVESVGFFIAVPVWRRILNHFGVRVRFREDVRIYSYSAVALVLPGGIWPIVSRASFYQRQNAGAAAITIASLVEVLVIGVAGACLYALVTIFRPDVRLWERPETGFAIIIASLALMHPKVFGKLVKWGLARTRQSASVQVIEFSLRELALWIGLQIVVLAIGGLAVFFLLLSLTDTTLETALPVIGAWAAATAAGTLFFWAPGTPVIRDGAMVIALSTSLPVAAALLFVLIMRLWAIASLLLFAAGVWLVLDLPPLVRKLVKKAR